jgi:hypothetical protein
MGDVSSGTAYGTIHQAGASSSDSTPAGVLAALTHDCEYLVIGYGGFSAGTAVDGSALLDILVDPAGGTSWSELIADLLVGNGWGSTMPNFASASGTTIFQPQYFHFPIWIPAGASIGVRARAKSSAPLSTSRVFMAAAGGNRNPASWWCGQSVETVGSIDTTNCRGEVHTTSLTNFGSWDDIGSPISGAAGAVQYAVQGPGTAISAADAMCFEFGVGGDRIGPSIWKGQSSSEVGTTFTVCGPIFAQIPDGAQMQVRSKALNAATGYDVAAYVVH